MSQRLASFVVIALVASLCGASVARAHCDNIEGPVVTAARQALADGDLRPVLRWVPPMAEEEVSTAFARARAVRALSPEAGELADRWFFETVVRLHRQGEGYAFDGLAPPGTAVDPAIAAVDAALASGEGGALARAMAAEAEAALRGRFARVAAAREHADESVEHGRELVAAYVELTHFAERLHALASGAEPHGEHGAPVGGHAEHPAPAAHGGLEPR